MVSSRAPQDVDVLAVLDSQIPSLGPEIPALYPRSLLTNPECYGKKLRRPTTLRRGTRASKIQDGEDVDVLRSPVYDSEILNQNI